MPSLLPGFEYDIFISYRQKDNKGDRWVTSFVEALKTELEGTFKEDISIYFDENPHDGLLEIHNVDKSLEGKLKCLVFIPVLSQTYCDPKSFAWQQEFCAFNRLALEDRFGRDIRLVSGNVSSRILPVKIHDLDSDDKAMVEKETGGVLRAIDFIYKEPGVNRPLKVSDSKADNLNKTDYRNQVNKVANAIKELIQAMKNPSADPRSTTSQQQTTASPSRRRVLAIAAASVLILAIAAFLLYPKVVAGPEELDPSIAVLPFENMSGDPEQEYFSDGIAEEILNSLAQIEGLQVTGRTSSFQFKGKSLDLKEVGEKLGVSTVLEGSVRKQGDQLRITVQLVNAGNGYHLWSERYDRQVTDVFAIQDEIAKAVSSKLKVTLINRPTAGDMPNSQAAYDLYLKGKYFFNQRGDGLNKGLEYFRQSIALDSTFAQAYATMALTYSIMTYYNMLPAPDGLREGKKYARKAIELDPGSSDAYTALGFMELHMERNWAKAREYLEEAVVRNPNNSLAFSQIGNYSQYITGDYQRAISSYEKAIDLDPLYFIAYAQLASVYLALDQPEKAYEYGQKGLELNNTSVLAITQLANVLWSLNRREQAIESLIKGLETTHRHPFIVADLCEVYSQIGRQIEAEELYAEIQERSKAEYISPFDLARVSGAMGREKEALDLFEIAFAEKFPGFTYWRKNEDPRVKSFIDRMAFPK